MQNGAPLRVPAAGIGICAMVVLVAYNWSLNDVFRYAVADAHSHDFDDDDAADVDDDDDDDVVPNISIDI